MCGRAATAGQADTVGGSVLEILVEFFATPADGIDVQAGDEREEGVATMTKAFGFESGQPATLLFVEARKQKDKTLMVFALGMVCLGKTTGALAAANLDGGHDTTSAGMAQQRRSLYKLPGSSF